MFGRVALRFRTQYEPDVFELEEQGKLHSDLFPNDDEGTLLSYGTIADVVDAESKTEISGQLPVLGAAIELEDLDDE